MDRADRPLGNLAVRFAGLTFRGTTRAAVEEFPPLALVITVNADFIVSAHSNERFARIINENCATLDGQLPFVLARWLARPRGMSIEKISGSDLVPELLSEAGKTGKRVFFLGATSSANATAVSVARERFGVDVEGYSPPLAKYPFSTQWRADCRARIEACRPHYVFVALGAPKQEFWMDDEKAWLAEADVKMCIGCGGSLDFLSGQVKRAPKWVQSMGMEGVYRVMTQPEWFRVKRLLRSCLVFMYVFR